MAKIESMAGRVLAYFASFLVASHALGAPGDKIKCDVEIVKSESEASTLLSSFELEAFDGKELRATLIPGTNLILSVGAKTDDEVVNLNANFSGVSLLVAMAISNKEIDDVTYPDDQATHSTAMILRTADASKIPKKLKGVKLPPTKIKLTKFIGDLIVSLTCKEKI